MTLAEANAALMEVPGGSATLILMVSVMAILVLVLLFAALLIGAHRRYRMLQESLHAESREVARLRSEVDLWTEAARRLKAEAGDEIDHEEDDDADDDRRRRDDDDDEDTGEIV